jgi:S1-C subfamily serine protease
MSRNRAAWMLVMLMSLAAPAEAQTTKPSIPQRLIDVSVLVKVSKNSIASGSGSGTLVVRQIDGKPACFLLTAAHVAEDLRDAKTGRFNDALIVADVLENGRRVGARTSDARVIRYDAEEDLAVLRVRDSRFVGEGARFVPESEQMIELGTGLYHVGSYRGEVGANSFATGVVAYVGRVYEGKVFDQTDATIHPGSSGGGIFLKDGRYIGMLLRGWSDGDNFNFYAPIRRIREWARDAGVEWLIDETVKPPSEAELKKMPIEGAKR